MRSPHTELEIHPEQRVFLSADYHLLPGVDPVALLQWSECFEAGDICIFLGDLYEAWVENRRGGRPGYEALHRSLRIIKEKGVETHLIVGNRDFMAGKSCQQETSMQIHPGPVLLRSGAKNLALFHGDELLPEDVGYLRYKAIVRHPLSQSLLKSLPMSSLMYLAEGTRQRSKNKLRQIPMDRFTPSLVLIQDLMREWKVDLAVAGHLHENRWVQGEEGSGCQVLSASSEKSIAYRIWKEGILGEEEIFEAQLG